MKRLTECDEQKVNTLLADGGTLLLHFGTDWCTPCKRQERMLLELADAHPEKLSVAKVNVEDHPEIATAYGVTCNPTLCLFGDGELVKRWAGLTDRETILALVWGDTDQSVPLG